MWPLILRELRAGSRGWANYWMRVVVAGVAATGIFLLLSEMEMGVPSAGPHVFQVMHQIIVGAIWVFVPLMTCDCLSSERRDGTLGLLFLTNLRAREIVAAKA